MAKVLVVGQDQVLLENLKRNLPLEKTFKLSTAASGFEAGIQAESFHPDCIVVDFSIGRVEALQICQNLRRNPQYGDVILIALSAGRRQHDQLRSLDDQRNLQETVRRGFARRTLEDLDRRPQRARLV